MIHAPPPRKIRALCLINTRPTPTSSSSTTCPTWPPNDDTNKGVVGMLQHVVLCYMRFKIHLQKQLRDYLAFFFPFWDFSPFLRNSASSFHWLSSSIFSVCSLFVRPASVTPPLISTIWCFRPYKPYIFCEYMILATCQCHSLLSWAQFTVV